MSTQGPAPGLPEEEVARWQAERRQARLEDDGDFRERVRLNPDTGSRLRF